jgi:hypothetical protein
MGKFAGFGIFLAVLLAAGFGHASQATRLKN